MIQRGPIRRLAKSLQRDYGMRHVLGTLLQTSVPRVARRFEVTISMGRAVDKNAERWRWLLYVVLAIAGALLTFVGARVQQNAPDDASCLKLVDTFSAAWSTGNADTPR